MAITTSSSMRVKPRWLGRFTALGAAAVLVGGIDGNDRDSFGRSIDGDGDLAGFGGCCFVRDRFD
jgi:hypothetical protein